MQTIRYVPVHGTLEPVQAAGAEFVPGADVVVTDEQAQELLRNQFFVDAKTGKNSNFVCPKCGADVLADAVFDPVLARTSGSPLRRLTIGDQRHCPGCLPGSDQTSASTATAETATSPSFSSAYASSSHDDDHLGDE